MLEFANVAPRWSLAELLFDAPRIHGFDDEAQDGLSLGVHGTMPLDPVLLKCFFELAPRDAMQKSIRWIRAGRVCRHFLLVFCGECCVRGQSRHHGRPSVNVRLACPSFDLVTKSPVSALLACIKGSSCFTSIVRKVAACSSRISRSCFKARRDRISCICLCVSGFGCPCAPRGRFVLCGFASGVPDACVKAQFCISPVQRKHGSQVFKQHGNWFEMLITVRAWSIDGYDHGVQMTTPSRTVSLFPWLLMMKIGRSSIPVSVPTPYTRVGHCDDVRWVSVSVLVSLMSKELTQSFKRIIALWTNIRSFWCHIFALICCKRNRNWRTSQTKRWWCFHVRYAQILHEPIVKKPLPHVQEKRRHRQTLRDHPRLPTIAEPPHMLIRVSCRSRQKWYPTRKKLHQKRKTRRSGGP